MRHILQVGLPLVALLLPASIHDARSQEAKKAIGPVLLKVVNEKGKATTFSADQLAKLSRETIKVKDRDGKDAIFEGVPLDVLLKAADVTLGKQLKGAMVANCLVVEAADGYRAVFSIPEVDPSLTDNRVFLTDKKDGKPLDDQEGPFRIVAPRDKLHMRWVRQVTGLTIQAVPGTLKPTKGGK